MARPKKSEALDLSQRMNLTLGVIDRMACPEGKQQVFLRDSEVPGLRVRVTAAGAKSFVYEAKLNRQTVRRTLGDVKLWTIDQARAEARRLAVLMDSGQDPRELERQQVALREAQKVAEQEKEAASKLVALTVGAVWAVYLEDRRPFWGERHYADHLKMSKAGGEVAKRGVKIAPDGTKPVTVSGPVYELLPLPLKDLTPAAVEAWAAKHAKVRPTFARLCWRCLKVFLNWCAEHPQYSVLLASSNPAKTKRAREVLGKPKAKDDSLQREQLQAWFAAVKQVQNPTISAYLQVLLLTGARPGEVLTLKWEDVNLQWNGLTIRDKVDGERVIPLTPYVAKLLADLPRRNEWVFASTRALKMDDRNVKRRERDAEEAGRQAAVGEVKPASATGHLTDPSASHRCACAAAGLEGLTLHGLRRSFSTLTEWLEIPSGVVAQIQGHKPSATAERHYKRRPLDLLRLHHERIEAWILEQAGIQFEAKEPATKLKLVGA